MHSGALTSLLIWLAGSVTRHPLLPVLFLTPSVSSEDPPGGGGLLYTAHPWSGMSEWLLSGCSGKHCGMTEVDDRHEEQRARGNSWQSKQPCTTSVPETFSPCCPETILCQPSVVTPAWMPKPLAAGTGPTQQIFLLSETGRAVLRQPIALGQRPTLPPSPPLFLVRTAVVHPSV